MIDKMENLKKHLKRQLEEAEKVGSDWVYIRKKEAETCYELVEAEETFIDMVDKKNV